MSTADADEQIALFLASGDFAVVGASNDPEKYGAKIFQALISKGRKAYPVNPGAREVQGHTAYPSVDKLPEPAEALSIITPPAVTERVVVEAAAAGCRRVWMQPGAESDEAIRLAEQGGLSVIAGGPCLLVALSLEGA
ncbi:MAG: CoA-binding protein [Planctomycetota bacterium]